MRLEQVLSRMATCPAKCFGDRRPVPDPVGMCRLATWSILKPIEMFTSRGFALAGCYRWGWCMGSWRIDRQAGSGSWLRKLGGKESHESRRRL